MNSILFVSSRAIALFCLVLVVLIAPPNASAASGEKVLYSFRGGSDGAGPDGTLYTDQAGNYFGTTSGGGGGTKCGGDLGCGTVFELAADGTETVLHAFSGGSDGAFPYGGVISDLAGDLYGTSSSGGTNNYGTIFTLSADGTESVLYAFKGGNDGLGPVGNLTFDNDYNLYGVTSAGGSGAVCGRGCGTVFEISSSGDEAVLYQFQGGSDGADPLGGLVRDSSGNFYGPTATGGSSTTCPNGTIGCGTVFEISADGSTETVLYTFQAGNDGSEPIGGLLIDTTGNFYGTTEFGGGAPNCPFGSLGCGTVFKLAPDRTETVLYAFKGGNDGQFPEGSLIMDQTGNMYGTTFAGGGTGCKNIGGGCGTIFKLAPSGKETVLYLFKGTHGMHPTSALLQGPGNFLYGTAGAGGAHHDGVVFRLKK